MKCNFNTIIITITLFDIDFNKYSLILTNTTHKHVKSIVLYTVHIVVTASYCVGNYRHPKTVAPTEYVTLETSCSFNKHNDYVAPITPSWLRSNLPKARRLWNERKILHQLCLLLVEENNLEFMNRRTYKASSSAHTRPYTYWDDYVHCWMSFVVLVPLLFFAVWPFDVVIYILRECG